MLPFGHGDGLTHYTQLWTNEIDSSLLVTKTHSLREADTTPQSATQGCLQETE